MSYKIISGILLFGVAFVLLYFYSAYVRRAFGKEGFLNVPASLFVPQVTPGGADEKSVLTPGTAYNQGTEKLVESAALPAMSIAEANANWGEMTSERCYRTDIGESLKKTRNFLQRTNNYTRQHPDSCSAYYHEMIGTFYKPFDGVGRTPTVGDNYPPSTAPCAGGGA
jgi:hypothetical protein